MKLFIKFLAVLFVFFFCDASNAQYEPTKKEFSLSGCDKKVELIEDESRKKRVLNVCRCEIEATDYDFINSSLQKGSLDFQEVILESSRITKKCEQLHAEK